jgi:lambda repressor-like predicted transcriptional regulator
MHPELIKGLIRQRGISLKKLSSQLGYNGASVGIALRHPQWKELKLKIAEFLSEPPERLWPDLFVGTNKLTGRKTIAKKGYGKVRKIHS